MIYAAIWAAATTSVVGTAGFSGTSVGLACFGLSPKASSIIAYAAVINNKANFILVLINYKIQIRHLKRN